MLARIRIRSLAVAALAVGGLMAPAAHAQSAADEFVSTSIARALATVPTNNVRTEILIPGSDGTPCFQIIVLGSGTVLSITFYKPIVDCII